MRTSSLSFGLAGDCGGGILLLVFENPRSAGIYQSRIQGNLSQSCQAATLFLRKMAGLTVPPVDEFGHGSGHGCGRVSVNKLLFMPLITAGYHP
jgi:hypothetical protein